MRCLLLVGFGNIAREFFITYICGNLYWYPIVVVLRVNTWCYKCLINRYLYRSTIKVIVLVSYKGIVNFNTCLVVELIGDNYYSKDLLLRTLLTANYLVTANKFLLYKNIRLVAPYLFTRIFFEAAVGGGVPFVKNLLKLRTIATIKSCCAIFNGTTNYLLTTLLTNSFSLTTALRLSTSLGLSEANPIKDICGFDALNKIIITAYLLYGNYSFGRYLYMVPMPVFKGFYWLVFNLGYVCRYISFFIAKGCSFHLEVSLCLFRTINTFTLTYFDYNSVILTTKAHGFFTSIAKGAGAIVTTYSLLSDLEYLQTCCRSNVCMYANSRLYSVCLIRSYYMFLLTIYTVPRFFMLLLLMRCNVSFFLTTKLVVFFKSRLAFASLKRVLAYFKGSVLYYRIL
ncbi:hypothetical protein JS520_00515 [Candidatus Vidania fulgoroideae]|nr:hypothetical protein JS520_00515 [Candidatus Vidania fulgoroideae]